MNKITTILGSLAAVLAAQVMTSCETNYPAPNELQPSYVCIETNSGRVLYAQNATQARPIGMMTNLVTACVVMDWVKAQNVSLNRTLQVPAAACQSAKTNLLKLQPGDSITLRDALYTTIMCDDTACAITLAQACGETLSSSNPIGAFISQMNDLAGRLLMSSTYFKGVSGETVSTSSARDLALLGSYAAGNPDLLAICSQSGVTVQVGGTSGVRSIAIRNNNRLLSASEHVDGLKAGHTGKSGACLMATARRASIKRTNPATGQPATYGQRLLVVMLGMPNSSTRYSTAAKFLQDGWNAWEAWLPSNDYKDKTKFIILPN